MTYFPFRVLLFSLYILDLYKNARIFTLCLKYFHDLMTYFLFRALLFSLYMKDCACVLLYFLTILKLSPKLFFRKLGHLGHNFLKPFLRLPFSHLI